MQAISNKLDIKLKLIVPGNRTPVAKRLPAKLDFTKLVTKAKELAAKHRMLADNEEPVISYKDEDDRTNLEVEDEDDLELAIAKALSS